MNETALVEKNRQGLITSATEWRMETFANNN